MTLTFLSSACTHSLTVSHILIHNNRRVPTKLPCQNSFTLGKTSIDLGNLDTSTELELAMTGTSITRPITIMTIHPRRQYRDISLIFFILTLLINLPHRNISWKLLTIPTLRLSASTPGRHMKMLLSKY